ncbi:MAG TPA: SusC/RagA family TonB-linked outer membrane protein [Balneolaceae bacterium]
MKNRSLICSTLLLFVIGFFASPVIAQSAQEGSLQGVVTDAETGDPLPGVNIYLSDLQIGAATDTEGNFEIDNIPAGSHPIRASFIGYQTFEGTVTITPSEITTLDIQLKPSSLQLGELVVSGVATSVKRGNLANAVAKIDAEELTGSISPPTVASALQGKIVGTNMVSAGGAPGGGVDIKLRGISTLGAGSSQPLIIVDGVYLNNTELQTGLSAVSGQASAAQDDGANRLADLNPDAIASIEILKGPSAAAIYGARANAGVVIIKTKRGSAGETQVSFNQDVGYSTMLNKLNYASWSEEKIERVFGEGTALAQTAKEAYRNAVANGNLHDYEDVIYGNEGRILNTQLSVSGGNSRTQFFVSGSFMDEEGIIRKTGFSRRSIRANIDHRLSDYVRISSSSNYINTESQRGWTGNGSAGSVAQAVKYTPNFAQLFPDGNGNYPDNPYFQLNPLELIEYGLNDQDVNRFLQSLTADVTLYNQNQHSLRLDLTAGLDFMNSTTMVYQPPFIQYQQSLPNPGDVIHSTTKALNLNAQAFLIYNTTVGSDDNSYDLTSQIGYAHFYKDQQLQQVRGRGLIPGQTNVENASLQEIYNQFFQSVTDVGYIAQQKVNWEDKVIATVGARLDRSTLNADQEHFYFFPKASLALNLANFDFWGVEQLQQFKLRVAYGETGGLPSFGATFEALNSGVISGNLGLVRSSRTVDPNLRPETASGLEFGTDIGLSSGRASISATYYIKSVYDLILDQQLPSSSGLQVMATNAADLQNRGIELSLNVIPIQTDNFVWNATLNWWKNDAEITNLKVPPFTTGGFGAALGTFYIAEGYSPTTIVGTPVENGRFTFYGNTQPDFQSSFFSNIHLFGNWEFNFLWSLSYGQKAINLSLLFSDGAGTTPDWNGDYDGDGVPNGMDRQEEGAGLYVDDATYLKLRETSLYYTVPSQFLSDLSNDAVKGVRLGVSGSNLLLFSGYSGYDPEVSEFGNSALQTGIGVAPYPSARQVMFHVEFDF